MKKLSKILKEVGNQNQYRSPEALAKQSQQQERKLREYNFHKSEERQLKIKLQELSERLKFIQSQIKEFEEDSLHDRNLDDFEF